MELLEHAHVLIKWVIHNSDQAQLGPDIPEDPYAPPSDGLEIVLDYREQVPDSNLVAVL